MAWQFYEKADNASSREKLICARISQIVKTVVEFISMMRGRNTLRLLTKYSILFIELDIVGENVRI